MKDILKHFVIGFFIGLIASGLMVWGYRTGKKHCTDTIVTDTVAITVTDTVTNWEPYIIHHYRTDTAYLPIIDTLVDTVTDTVLVQIPIEMYRYDTTIIDTNYTTHLRAVLTGFHTSIDTLTIRTEIMPPAPPKKPWYTNFCPAVGIGYGTGGFGVFAGVGYKI